MYKYNIFILSSIVFNYLVQIISMYKYNIFILSSIVFNYFL